MNGGFADNESRIIMKKHLIAAAIGGLASHAYADPAVQYQLDDIVVTAARTPQPLRTALGDVTVVTAEQIRQAGQTTLADVLQTQPGVEISSNGGPGTTASVYLRGANAGHTLVLVDGMRLGSATTGATALENIPIDQIERIEILRGPASHLYGSDAIGGVIQIFTKSGQGAPRANFSAGLGSFNTRNLSGGYGGEIGHTRFSLQAGQTESDGISAYANGNPGYVNQNRDKDGYRNTSLALKLAQTVAVGQEIGVDGFISSGRNHYDGYTSTTDYFSDQTLSTFDIYSKNRINARWNSLLRVGTGADHLDDYSPGKDVFNTDQNQLLWQNDIAAGPGTAILGFERVEQKVSGSTAYSVASRTIQSWFAGYQARLGNHDLQLNLRNDDNTQFGRHGTGYLGYGYQISPRWRVSAGAGNAFKAPSFNGLYWPALGNPDLRPERSRNKEAALHYDSGVRHFSAVVFDNRVSDLIAWAPIAPDSYTWLPANVDRATLRGVTLSGATAVGDFLLDANLTLQNPKDAATGKRLIKRAKEHGALKLGRALGAWTLAGEWVVSGRRYADAGNTLKMAGYGLVNLTASRALDRDWTLQTRIDNLFDKSYELTRGFNTPGLNIFVGVRYQPTK
ncbi:MAG: TonB-dependent receptor [Hydrogenophilales bacterium CG03_land_8_20_14_0_80_62_28]|nr:MAG: TonB-dependent receptor [Hydrogenophilales bacterium CG03_land_8_20_14_0_80_62_28]PIW37674.1 MAG: TonB-dependent receptor [Hydrogenophilales bacterium CG15_BIG_FIL_POST_REV_8_21_14_020_62_31]